MTSIWEASRKPSQTDRFAIKQGSKSLRNYKKFSTLQLWRHEVAVERQMQSRHLALLLAQLERVIDIGSAEITQVQLATWFDQARISYVTWKTIHEHWTELLANTKHVEGANKSSKLLVGQAAGTWVFVFGQGVVVQKDGKSWLQDVRERGRIEFDPTAGANE